MKTFLLIPNMNIFLEEFRSKKVFHVRVAKRWSNSKVQLNNALETMEILYSFWGPLAWSTTHQAHLNHCFENNSFYSGIFSQTELLPVNLVRNILKLLRTCFAHFYTIFICRQRLSTNVVSCTDPRRAGDGRALESFYFFKLNKLCEHTFEWTQGDIEPLQHGIRVTGRE